MSNTISLKKLQAVKNGKYNLGDVVLEKNGENVVLSAKGQEYETVKIYQTTNPNVLGTIEIRNNPEYSTRINIREMSDIAVDPTSNSSILFKDSATFQGTYLVRPSMANFIKSNIKDWKENLKFEIEPSILDILEEQAKATMETENLSTFYIEHEGKVLTFTKETSANLKRIVDDIKRKTLIKTNISTKQEALLEKYEAMVKAEKENKVCAMTVSYGQRDLRHTFWKNDELGSVEHNEMQSKFKANAKSVAKADNKEVKAEDYTDVEEILA